MELPRFLDHLWYSLQVHEFHCVEIAASCSKTQKQASKKPKIQHPDLSVRVLRFAETLQGVLRQEFRFSVSPQLQANKSIRMQSLWE